MENYKGVKYYIKKLKNHNNQTYYCGYIVFDDIEWLCDLCKDISEYGEGCYFIDRMFSIYGGCTFYSRETSTFGFDTNHIVDIQEPKSKNFVIKQCMNIIDQILDYNK